jgi:hypothetical protein
MMWSVGRRGAATAALRSVGAAWVGRTQAGVGASTPFSSALFVAAKLPPPALSLGGHHARSNSGPSGVVGGVLRAAQIYRAMQGKQPCVFCFSFFCRQWG